MGLARYYDAAFVVSPCPSCLDKNKERQQRLDAHAPKTLYHRTTKTVARLVKEQGGRMLRGQGGIAGGGIYFAESPEQTLWKAELSGKGQGSVILECRVAAGNVQVLDRDADPRLTFRALAQRGYDSVLVQRGICQEPGPGFGKPSGDEYVVYSWDQVQVVREVTV